MDSLKVGRYDIQLTNMGKPVEWELPAATEEQICHFSYVIPLDKRCKQGIILGEDELNELLKPILGQSFLGKVEYKVEKRRIISLQDTAVVGYNRHGVIDPRLPSKIAHIWEIYIDKRIFTGCDDINWLSDFGILISCELEDDEADMLFAHDLKNKLLQQAGGHA